MKQEHEAPSCERMSSSIQSHAMLRGMVTTTLVTLIALALTRILKATSL